VARAEAEAEQGLRLCELEAAYQAYSEALKARVAAEEVADTARAAEEAAGAAVLALASTMISTVSSPHLIEMHQPAHASAHQGVSSPHLIETHQPAHASAHHGTPPSPHLMETYRDAEEGGEALISPDASGTLADDSPLARARRQLHTFRGQMASLAEVVAKLELEAARVMVDSEEVGVVEAARVAVAQVEAAARVVVDSEEGGTALVAAEPPPPALPPSAALHSPALSSPALSSVIRIGMARIAHEQSTASTCSAASPSTWSRAVSAAPLLRRILDSAERGPQATARGRERR